MERAWTLIQKIGGALLLAEIVIFLLGSAHAGHALRNPREFAAASDQVIGGILREIINAAHWIAAKGR
jgi:hypothetical protein